MKNHRIALWSFFASIFSVILFATGCNLFGNNSSGDIMPITQATIIDIDNQDKTKALSKEVAGLKIEIPANAMNVNYSLNIKKIITEVDDTSASLIKSNLTLPNDLLLISPVYIISLTTQNNGITSSSIRANMLGSDLVLSSPASLTIPLNAHQPNWAKYNYFIASGDDSKNWQFEPLSCFENINAVVKRFLTISKYSCVVAQLKETYTDINYLEITVSKPNFVPGITKKFTENPLLSAAIGAPTPIDYSQTSAKFPIIKLLAMTPFDFGPNLKSTQLVPPYYKEITLTAANFQSQAGNIATFTLPIELNGVTYNDTIHPAGIFANAMWISPSNVCYSTDLICFGFSPLIRAFASLYSPLENANDVFVTNPVVFSFTQQMRVDTLDSAITIEPPIPFIASYSYTEDSLNRLTITPATAWDYSTQYTVTLATSALDIAGNLLSAPVHAVFTTIADSSLNPTLVSPALSMRKFARAGEPVVISFPDSVKTDSVVKGTGIVVEESGAEVQDYSLTWNTNNTLLELVFDGGLTRLATYTVSVFADHVKYADDTNIANTMTATFTVCYFDTAFGTSARPFEVASAADLLIVGLEEYNDKHYIQTQDIDLAAFDDTYDDGQGWKPLDFNGVYNGNNKKISNLCISRPDTDNVGLFAAANSAEIKNLTLDVAYVYGNNNVGAICGSAYDTDFLLCSVINSVITGEGNKIGGFAGNAGTGSNIQSSSLSNSEISGAEYVGGIFGYQTLNTNIDCCTSSNDCSYIASVKNAGCIAGATTLSSNISSSFGNGYIETFLNAGGITGELTNNCKIEDSSVVELLVFCENYAGAIAGRTSDASKIKNCVNYDNTIMIINNSYAGGIAGHITNNSEIYKCISKGRIICKAYLGGIAGYCEANSKIHSSYFDGALYGINTGDFENQINIGGIAGAASNSILQDSYSSGTIVGNNSTYIGGLAGSIENSSVFTSYSQTGFSYKGYGAGLVGNTKTSGIINSVALNPEIATSTAHWGVITANLEEYDPKKCYALDTLPSTTDPLKDGTRHPASTFKTQEFYTNPENWLLPAWDFTSVWQIETPGATFPTLLNLPPLLY